MEPVNISNIRNSMQAESAVRAQSIREASLNTDRQQTKAAEEVSSQAAALKTEDTAAKGVYGDVLDISEDGDTMTARPEALQALDDGYVLLKGQEQQTEDDEKAKERIKALSEPSESSKVIEQLKKEQEKKDEQKAEEAADAARSASLTGYSDDMIDTLYRQGKIDSRAYNAEMDRRERLDEMNAPEDNGRKQEVQDNLSETAEELGALNAEASNDALMTEAYATAGENGRVDLVKDIFADNSVN
ncbi:MAG: hypothetical protein IJ058_02870 [Lachnospiraceae bacterium]|nr:hypothetical protein [Lachnospiraceae bacterium]